MFLRCVSISTSEIKIYRGGQQLENRFKKITLLFLALLMISSCNDPALNTDTNSVDGSNTNKTSNNNAVPLLNNLVISSFNSSSIKLQQPTFSIVGHPTPTVNAYIGINGVITASGSTVSGSVQGPVDVSSGSYQFTGLIYSTDYKIIVVAENYEGYSVKQIVQSTQGSGFSDVATVTSNAYTVSAGGTANETITNVPFGRSKTSFKAALTKGESHQTWNDAAIHDPVATNDTLVVTAQDGTTIVTYAITTNAEPIYSVFNTGPAGGTIFYDKGSYSNDWRYLEVAPFDQSAGGVQWDTCYGSCVTTGATATAVGTGQANTTTIISIQGIGSYAAELCDSVVLNGYSDWFLPSKDELNLIHIACSFYPSWYWSSSEVNISNAWTQSFNDGAQSNSWGKASTAIRVRCARAF